MGANHHASSFTAVESQVSQLVGGDTTRFSTYYVSTKASTKTQIFTSSIGSYLQVNSFYSQSGAGGELWIYAGPDDTYPLIMNCVYAAGECKTPIPSPMYSKFGWSLYGQSDGTNYITVPYSHYNAKGVASAPISDNIDSYLNESNPTNNYGNATTIVFGNTGATNKIWPILDFDLSSLSAISSCESAVLVLQPRTDVYFENIRICALLSDWVETEVTYNIRKTGVDWNVAGVVGGTDVRSTPAWTGSCNFVNGEKYGFELTDLVNEWLSGSLPNYGVIMYNTYVHASQSTSFHSRQASTVAYRPVLNIEY